MLDRLDEIAEESTRGGFSLFLGNATATFISAIVVVIIARLLGPDNYGIYSLCLTIPSLAVAMTSLGMSQALTRYSARLTSESRGPELATMFRSVFVFSLLLAVVALIVVLLLSDELAAFGLSRPGIGEYVRLASLLILFQVIFTTTSSALIGLGGMADASLILTVQSASKAVASPILVLVGLSVAGAILGHIAGFVVAAILGLILLFAKRYRDLSAGSRGSSIGYVESLRVAVKYGLPLYLGGLLTTLLTQYQNLVLAHDVPDFEIGNFNAAVNFSALLSLVAYPVATALFPAFSKIDPHSESDDLKKMFEISVKYGSLLLVPASMIVALLSRDLVFTIYGGGYGSAPLYLSIYAGIFLLAGFGYLILGPLFNGIGETKETLKITIVTAALFLPAAPLMAEAYQVVGLIVAFLASNLAGTAYGLSAAYKKFHLKLDLDSSLRIYLASAISIIPTLLLLSALNLPSLLNIAVGGFTYLASYLTFAPLTGAIKRPDVENLSQILHKIKIVNPIIKPVIIYENLLLSNGRRKEHAPRHNQAEVDRMEMSNNVACVLACGCPESNIDSARVEKFLKENGWKTTSNFKKADLTIFRACALTELEEEESLEIIRKIKTEKKGNARLIVWGCLPEINPEALKREYDGITFGEREIGAFNEIVEAKKPIQEIEANCLIPTFPLYEGVSRHLPGNLFTRVADRFDVAKLGPPTFFIKVSTGCLGGCTFCGVCRSRGTVLSRSIDRVLCEFRDGLSRGFKYFGLLATDLGAYGRDQGYTLVDLLNEMIKEKGDFHIALRNVNPYYLNEMFEELQPIFSSGKICFLSSAVESGSDRILELMGRKYKVENFKKCIETINREYPNILLRTQIMAGFPTETEEDFQRSMQLLEELRFDWVEVYKFSNRPGTIAATMDDQVQEKIKEARFRKMLARSLKKCPLRKIKHIMRLK